MQRPRTTRDAAANEYMDFLEQEVSRLTHELAAYEKGVVHAFHKSTKKQFKHLSDSFNDADIDISKDDKQFEKFVKFQEVAPKILNNLTISEEIMKKNGIDPNSEEIDTSPESYVKNG
jgi:hypothetical protein